ncbi:MAG: response regulator [Candidatus Omnitrophica bacterium]|nr:response regulator [Candidatus Omnitrophota bacterium]
MAKRKIMIVDDEKDFLDIVKLNLEHTGRYKVKTLSSSTGIIDKVKDFKPDLIIMDLLMPVLGGIEACLLLRKDPVARRVPVIVLSALEKEEDRKKADSVGAIDYIVKPINVSNLLERIDSAIKRKKRKNNQ